MHPINLCQSSLKSIKLFRYFPLLAGFFCFTMSFGQTNDYCIPFYSGGCSVVSRITNVTLNGETTDLNNDSQCGEGTIGYYTFYSGLDKPDLAVGNTYTLSVSADYTLPQFEEVKAWIDFNNDQVLDSLEMIANSDGNGLPNGTGTFNFTIPDTVPPGDYRMRVRMEYFISDFTSCDSAVNGETEDYVVHIYQLSGCQGTPTAGTPDNSDLEVCTGNTFSLSVSGASVPADNLIRNWQSSPAGENNWTDISGAHNPTYIVGQGIITATDFRYKVTCTTSNESDTSAIIAVSLKPDTTCYCLPMYSNDCSSQDQINNVTLIGESNLINNSTACSPDNYGDYTDLNPADLYRDSTYTLQVSTDYYTPQYEQVRAWIDYNTNGSFESNEEIASTEGNGLDGGGNFEFQIPENVIPGNYRLRVRLAFSSNGIDFGACDSVGYGETEDYTIKVIPLDTCSSAPVAGQIIDDFSVCAGEAFSLSVSGSSSAEEGLTRVWQSSPTGTGDWTAIDDSPYSTYVVEEGIQDTTYYRFKITCANSGESAYSAIVQVSLNPITECYCIPTYLAPCSSGDQINEVILSGETDTLNNTTGCSNNNYGDYTELTPPNLVPGNSYTLSVGTNNDSPGSEDVRAWIDYNHNAVFEDNEEIANTQGNGLPTDGLGAFSFSVPDTVSPGSYRMRIRLSFLGGANLSPCDNEEWGETEDYSIEIIPVPDCAKPTALTVNAITDHSAHISWTPGGNETQWELRYGAPGFNFNQGTAVIVTGSPDTTLTNLTINTNYEIVLRALCSASDSSFITGPEDFKTYKTPPDNNYLCDAFELLPNTGCEQLYTNTNAFPQPDEPTGSCLTSFQGNNSVWFYFVATDSSATVTTNADETDFDTEILVFKAPSDCADLSSLGEEIGCAKTNDEAQLHHLIPGDTYYVRITGFNNEEGNFCLKLLMNELSVNTPYFQNFAYYPNPVKGQLTLQSQHPIQQIEVYTLSGKKISEQQPRQSQTLLSTKSLQQGIYLIKIKIGGQTKTFRLIKK